MLKITAHLFFLKKKIRIIIFRKKTFHKTGNIVPISLEPLKAYAMKSHDEIAIIMNSSKNCHVFKNLTFGSFSLFTEPCFSISYIAYFFNKS